jgi:hypothetical protein
VPAATVDSAFVLLDRASGPIRKIRRELRGMQRDAEGAAAAMDQVSGPRSARKLETLAGETRQVRQETSRAGTAMSSTERDMHRLERRTTSLTRETRRAKIEWGGLSKVLMMLKWPGIIAGVGGLTQALGGLAGGAVALIPNLLNVGGAAASMGTMLVGAGLAVGTFKLATKGLDKALAGNKKALAALTPEGRAFVQIMREMRPEIQRTRRVAQQGLFPGLGALLGDLRSQAPQIRQIVRQTAGDLGGLARFGGQQISSPGFMRELIQLSDQGGRALGAAARSAFYFARAAEHIMVAAGPLTDWLGNTVEGWGKTAERQAKVGMETGKLDRYFVRVRHTLTTLFDVGKHTWGAIHGLLKAATGQSDSLWGSIDKGARRWDQWSNSFVGQNRMRRWFDDVRPTLDATVGLFGDLAKAIGHLSSGPEGAQMLESLRKAVPALGHGMQSLLSSFGPAAIDALASGAQLLGTLAGHAGPLTLVAVAVGTTAKAINSLIDALGPLGPQLAAFASTAFVLKRLGILGGGGGGGGAGGGGMMPLILPGGRGGAGAARGGMTAGESALLGAGGGAAASRLAMMRGAIGGAPGYLRGTYGLARGFGYGRAASAAAAGGGLLGLGSEASMASRGLGAAGKFFWPLALGSGILGALGTQGGPLAKAQGGLSAVTLGLVPRPVSAEEKRTGGGAFASTYLQRLQELDQRFPGRTTVAGQQRTVGRLQHEIQTLPGNDAFNQNQKDLHRATNLLRDELSRRRRLLLESQRQTVDDLNAKSTAHGQAMATDFAQAFDIRAHGPAGPIVAMRKTVDGVLAEQRRLPGAGARVLDEASLSWIAAAAQHNPALKKEYERLVHGIEDKFSALGKHVAVVNGQILVGSRSEWHNIRLAMVTNTEKAREEVSKDFTAIQQQAVGALTAMGFSPAAARQLVQNLESGGTGGAAAAQTLTPGNAPKAAAPGGKGAGSGLVGTGKPRATGGRLAGQGLQDKIPMIDGGLAAPGELVVNRHSERDDDREKALANRLLAFAGVNFRLPTIAQRVTGEHRKHSAPIEQASRDGCHGMATGTRIGSGLAGVAAGASGGYGGPFGSGDGFIPVTALAKDKFGLTATAGRTNHNTNTIYGSVSDHSWGGAVDYSNAGSPTPQMDAWSKFWVGHVLSGSALGPSPIKQMLYRTLIGGNHFNHVHTALLREFAFSAPKMSAIISAKTHGAPLNLSGSAAVTPAAARSIAALKAPTSGLSGVPGALSRRAGQIYAAGLTQKINARLGAGTTTTGGGLGGPGGGKTVGASTFGGPGDPGTGSTGYRGDNLYQKPDSFAELKMGTALGGLPYMAGMKVTGPKGSKTLYKRDIGLGGGPVSGHSRDIDLWFQAANDLGVSGLGLVKVEPAKARGGRVGRGPVWGGWHGKGTDTVVHRPTVFGAGENGPERVNITPVGTSGAGDMTVHIHPGAIKVEGHANNSTLEKAVAKHVEAFAKAVQDEIASGSESDEAAVMA